MPASSTTIRGPSLPASTATRRAGACGRVAQRVVDQVAQHHGQQRRVASHRHRRIRCLQLQVLPPDQRARCRLGQLVARHGPQIHLGRVRGQAADGLEPRQSEQLLGQPRGAVAAFERGPQRAPALGLGGGTQRDLGLRTDGRNGSAQLVRGVGSEASLAVEQYGDAGEESVQRIHDRGDLGRRPGPRHGTQIVGVSLGEG